MPVAEPEEGTSGVAPTTVLTAPSAATVATTDLSSAPMGDAIAISSAIATVLSTGIRWSSAMSNAPGRLIQCKRRCRREEIFMGLTGRFFCLNKKRQISALE
jgi:hypothetical protein